MKIIRRIEIGVVKKTALKESRFPAFGKSRLFFMPDRKNNYFG